MFHESFRTPFWREFKSIKQGAEYFHVSEPTINRSLDGTVPINPMAEKLMLIKLLGYLPIYLRWCGFRVCEKRAIIITPSGREFSPKELESFVFWRDEHRQLVEKFGHIDQPKVYPAKENVLPFKGGRRMKAVAWMPSESES
ncbi:phage protein [Vibrio campbellii]|uniref:S-adenosylhomocysteine hydrolase n=1 Tax=Vibrio campbellii TaxID=680 RepID=A0ABY5IFI0_9VIBR|nr:phage protein [Vibrio campbellii]UTZ24832.1 S-adenosylhomocysteine hydrolase [Vibrio campbellii]UTZ33040.1 S-adenosylhomocysteine hydrolase [Vibrio campbellii]